jgi:hypothetical protein
MHLAAMSRLNSWEIAARIDPMLKVDTARRRISFRPKMSDAREKIGWNTQDARRNEVPAQKASVAVPPRSWEMV